MVDRLGCSIRCPLSQNVTNIVGLDGSPNPTYLFLGEAPGELEDEKGFPFVGDSGRLLRWLIKNSGIDNYAFFNTVCCRPTEMKVEKYVTKIKNRTPTWDEIKTCRPNLHKMIDTIKPKVIIAVGKSALSSLIDTPPKKIEIGDSRGIKYFYKNIPVISTYHPATVLYGNKDAMNSILDDIYYATQIVKGVNETVETYIITDVKQFNDVIYELYQSFEFSADIEVSKAGTIIGISFSWLEDIGVYVPLYTFNDFYEEPFWKESQEYVTKQISQVILDNYSTTIWHNAMYDTRMIYYHWGIPISQCQDTRLMWGAIADTKFSGNVLESSLAYLTDKFFPWLKSYKKKVTGRFDTKEDIDYGKLPLNVIGTYGATDAIVTLKLKHIFQQMLDNNQTGVII